MYIWQGFQYRWALYTIFVLQKLLLGTCSLCHGIEISAMITFVSSISGILVCDFRRLGVHASSHLVFLVRTALRTTAAGRQPSLAHSRQEGFGVITICKVKSEKTLCPTHISFKLINAINNLSTLVHQFTKCSQYLVSPELL
jgi:hypothetical protein